MTVTVHFHSYFKDLAGCVQTTEAVSPGTTVGELHARLMDRFQKLRQMRKSTLIAVGVVAGYLSEDEDDGAIGLTPKGWAWYTRDLYKRG